MQNKLDNDLKKLVHAEKEHSDSKRSGNLTDAGICAFAHEQKITMFGHTFTMAELDTISRFSCQLERAANSILDQTQILDGAIFIVKVLNKETQISFGGISKK